MARLGSRIRQKDYTTVQERQAEGLPEVGCGDEEVVHKTQVRTHHGDQTGISECQEDRMPDMGRIQIRMVVYDNPSIARGAGQSFGVTKATT